MRERPGHPLSTTRQHDRVGGFLLSISMSRVHVDIHVDMRRAPLAGDAGKLLIILVGSAGHGSGFGRDDGL